MRALPLALAAPLAGCFGPEPVLATANVTQSARTLKLPPADRARIFVFTGRSPLFTDGSGPLTQHILAADIYVDDVKIGTVNLGEAMVFDVAPGRYTFSWTPYNRKAGWGETMMTAAFNFRGGTIVRISADKFRTTYSMQQSVMTPLLEKD